MQLYGYEYDHDGLTYCTYGFSEEVPHVVLPYAIPAEYDGSVVFFIECEEDDGYWNLGPFHVENADEAEDHYHSMLENGRCVGELVAA